FNIVVNGMPATFDPTSENALRSFEDNNPDTLLPFSIAHARWLRTPKSNAGSIILEIKDSNSANLALEQGLASNYSFLSVHKLMPKLTQCFNCQGYGHIAKACKDPIKCGLCAGSHATKTC
ncbi:hypothetical protein B0H11DRAFT_1610642, partial [Mycena galericulata]